jgi:biotin carboxyl carrier protein
VSLRLADGQAAGKPITLYWAEKGGDRWVAVNGCTYRLSRPRPHQARPASETGEEQVRAPMPAQVRMLQVAEGERVEKGQSLLLLEAMKMEIRVKAPASGTVTRLLVENGQAVEKEQVLAEVTPDKGE